MPLRQSTFLYNQLIAHSQTQWRQSQRQQYLPSWSVVMVKQYNLWRIPSLLAWRSFYKQPMSYQKAPRVDVSWRRTPIQSGPLSSSISRWVYYLSLLASVVVEHKYMVMNKAPQSVSHVPGPNTNTSTSSVHTQL